MNKIYILVPLIGMLLFGGYYMNFSKGYEANMATIKAKADAEIKAKKEADLKSREKAYQLAIEAAAKRKLEREEKERIEAAKKEARLQADERREKAEADHRLLKEQVARLKKELTGVETEVAKYEEVKKSHASELVFLKEFVQKAEANQKYYYDLLDKIAAADKAKAEAEALALIAKKNS
jgi:DNA repair exonuclease SbcCD ATPase subunit